MKAGLGAKLLPLEACDLPADDCWTRRELSRS